MKKILIIIFVLINTKMNTTEKEKRTKKREEEWKRRGGNVHNYMPISYHNPIVKRLAGNIKNTVFIDKEKKELFEKLNNDQINNIKNNKDQPKIASKVKEQIVKLLEEANLSLLSNNNIENSKQFAEKIKDFISFEGLPHFVDSERKNYNLYGRIIEKIKILINEYYNDNKEYKGKLEEKLNNTIYAIIQSIYHIQNNMTYKDIFETIKDNNSIKLTTMNDFLEKKEEAEKLKQYEKQGNAKTIKE
jgi:hypothetical protein